MLAPPQLLTRVEPGIPDRLSGPRDALAAAHPLVAVAPCSAPTGLDSGEPRCRRNTASTANDPTASSSDCQFCRLRFQKSADPRYPTQSIGSSRWPSCSLL